MPKNKVETETKTTGIRSVKWRDSVKGKDIWIPFISHQPDITEKVVMSRYFIKERYHLSLQYNTWYAFTQTLFRVNYYLLFTWFFRSLSVWSWSWRLLVRRPHLTPRPLEPPSLSSELFFSPVFFLVLFLLISVTSVIHSRCGSSRDSKQTVSVQNLNGGTSKRSVQGRLL